MDLETITSRQAIDAARMLHPYADARLNEKLGPLVVVRGRGACVYDEAGTEYIEGLAGLWCVALGFSEQRLIDAAARQLAELPFYHLFGNKSHRPAIELAEKLVELAPGRLERVFYTNSGSEANDTVVKFLHYYNNARGRTAKKKIISRQRAYHGVTTISASLGGLPINHRDFDIPIPGVLHVACPHYWKFGRPGESEEAFANRLAQELEDLIAKEGADTIAAFIGEPINGAGGVITPPAGYWPAVEAVCRRHDILLVIDEVITGFGRTGRMFASELYGIEPDVLVLSKQLTSAYQPLAAVLMTDELYQGIAGNTAKIGALGHGFTSGGNPVSTAVALENIRIIEERGVVARVAEIAPLLQEGLRRFADHPLVGEVRGIGLIAGAELVADRASRQPFDPVGRVGAHVAQRCQAHGLILRAIGDTIAICPPLIVDEKQIGTIVYTLGRALDEIQAALSRDAN